MLMACNQVETSCRTQATKVKWVAASNSSLITIEEEIIKAEEEEEVTEEEATTKAEEVTTKVRTSHLNNTSSRCPKDTLCRPSSLQWELDQPSNRFLK
jgi:hypothetical protein